MSLEKVPGVSNNTPYSECCTITCMPHVAIIIVDYNGEAETRECLKSLQALNHDTFSFSVTVVDNGSKEPLKISEEDMPKGTTIIRSDANLGFTSGNNLGIKQALQETDPDYFLLLNNDTTVDAQALHEMVTCAENNERAGIITPKIFFSSGREYHKQSYLDTERGRVLWYAGGTIDWRNLDAFHRGVDEVDRGHFDHQTESDYATGCAALIPRMILDKVIGFQDEYFLYLEDVDLSMRIIQAGYRMLFCPAAHVWHKNAGSSGGAGSALHQYYQTRNRLYFFFKYGQVRSRLTLSRFVFKLLLCGTPMERRGTLDWILGRMGKQSVL